MLTEHYDNYGNNGRPGRKTTIIIDTIIGRTPFAFRATIDFEFSVRYTTYAGAVCSK